MDSLLNGYRKVYKYRRHIAGALALTLFVKNGKRNLIPEYLLVPYTASLECTKYPGEYQRWLIRVAKRDCGYDGKVFPYVTTLLSTVSGGFYGVGPLKPVCYVGIPRTYYCANLIEVSDIDLRFIFGKAILPNSKTEERFLDSLVLSDSAQKYSVAMQLMYMKGNWALLEALLSPAVVMLGYSLCVHLPKFLFTGSSNFFTFFRFQLLAIAASYFLCKLAWAQLYQIRNYRVSKQAAEISDEYAQGAVEYYRKERDFNMACRILLGQKGEKRFTALGNLRDGLLLNWNGPPTTDLERQAKGILDRFTQNKDVAEVS